MKTKMKLGFGLMLTLIIMLGYGFKSVDKMVATTTHQPVKPISENTKLAGSELFKNNCAACHGINRQGNPPTFPSLINISEKYTKAQIGDLLKTGRNIMPSFSHISESEREAIVGYLYGESTNAVATTKVIPEENGKNIFVANCVRCHKTSPNDKTPIDQKPWGMKPPILGGVNNRVGINQFKQILNMGPCYMPSFASLKDKDKEDLYAYLSTLKSDNISTNSKMYGMRRGCGMKRLK